MPIIKLNNSIIRLNNSIIFNKDKDPNIVVIDDRTYKTVTIGTQTWIAENLDYQIPDIAFNPSYDTGERQAQMYYARNSDYSLDGNYKLGMMYNGPAVAYRLVSLIPTLIPGWHVATRTDWNTLITTIGGSTNVNKLKATDNSILQDFPSGWNGTNEYSFNILPGGNGSRNPNYAPTYNGLGTMIRYRLGDGTGYNTNTININQSSYSISTNSPYSYFGYVRLVKDT